MPRDSAKPMSVNLVEILIRKEIPVSLDFATRVSAESVTFRNLARQRPLLSGKNGENANPCRSHSATTSSSGSRWSRLYSF